MRFSQAVSVLLAFAAVCGRSEANGEDLPAHRYIVRHGDSMGVVADGSANREPVGTLVYSSTSGSSAYASSWAYTIGDDVRTIAVCGSSVTTLIVKVNGGGSGENEPGPSFDYALYPECPTADDVDPIAGTAGTFVLPNDGDHIVEIDYSAGPVPIPRDLWIGLYPSVGTAGWFVGSPAELGISWNHYEHPLLGCETRFAGSVYASFYAQIYGIVGAAAPTPANPSPDDTMTEVDLEADLSWGEGALRGGDNAGKARTFKPAAFDLVGRTYSMEEQDEEDGGGGFEPTFECGTMERYLAEQVEERSSAGACPVAGVCDRQETRDALIPDATTPPVTFRLSVHVFCYDDGTGCLSDPVEVDNQINRLNLDYLEYLDARINFIYEVQFHNDSRYRDVMQGDVDSMKNEYADSPDTKLNVYVALGIDFGSSFAYLPASGISLSATGGVFMNSPMWSSNGTVLAHEVGHALGLMHTQTGIDNEGDTDPGTMLPCNHMCRDLAGDFSGDTTGDFCSDTAPTPVNWSCADPPGTDPCSDPPATWAPTNFRNFMGYGSCRSEWTPQQLGRVHCWSAVVLSSWMEEPACLPTYDVYLGTDNPPTTAVCSDLEDTTCDPGPLDCDTTYYWQVVSRQFDFTTEGPVWSFSTIGGGDCNNNGTPDDCEVALEMTEDCQSNGIPDDCDVDPADPDGNGEVSADADHNGIPDECMPPMQPLAPAAPPHEVSKNRYVSIDSSTSGATSIGIKVQLASMKRCSGAPYRACTGDEDCEATVPGSGTCIEHSDVETAGPWWVQAPQQEPLGCLPGPCTDEDWFARVDSTPYFDVWTLSTLHIGDCEIIPVATYEVWACLPPDGTICTGPLTIGTIEQPFVSPGFRGNYGDAVGPVDAITEQFTPPDGFTNVIDVSGYILTQQNYGTPNKPQTHPTWVDLHGLGDGNPPQYILNVSDMGQILKAFAGDAWTDDPGNMDPGQCQ